jgi:type IV pilus assembly protein PilW
VSGEKELMSNVEALRVLYGEDTDNDHWPNHYLNESQVSDWKNVVSMRLSVVLNSTQIRT